MAKKGGKGRKGGGGGGAGPKQRKYERDNKGRFASTGSGGATARGGRLLTAKGNKRTARALAGKTKTIEAKGQKGVLAKPKGLKAESTNKLKTGIFISKRRAVNAQLANKPDQAVVNIPGRFTGRAGKSFDASITRAVATVKASKDAKFKTKAEVKADQAKAKAAKEAKPKRIRSVESLRVSRAKQIEKRRSITTNPAGVRASAAAKMAANATRTQQRAAAFYKAGGKPAAAKPAGKPASTAAERIKIKTPIRRAMSANRASVVTPGQRSRLETGKGAKIKGARLNSSIAKPRTAGNTKPQVASRVKRKLAAENVKMNKIVRAERVGARQGKQYERSLKRQTTLQRAKTFLESGKLPGKDNSIAAQRNTKQARQRLAAKNAERRTAAPKPASTAAERRSQAAKKPTKKTKTELQTLQQADRLMGKLSKRQASINVDKVGLDEGLRQVRRNNSRAGIVNRALDKRGLLGKYQKLTAGADAIHGTSAGKGIKQPAAKLAAARRKSVGSISEAKAGRIISRIDANRPGLRRASGSARKTANAIRTQQRATDFALAASARGRKQGKNLSVNQSLQRAIKNASAKRKPRGMR